MARASGSGSVERPPHAIAPVRPRTLRAALIVITVLAGVMSALALALILPVFPGASAAVELLFMAVIWVYLIAGLMAWWRRPNSAIGVLLISCSLALFANNLVNVPLPGFALVGMVVGTAIYAVIIHMLLAFPSGALPDRTSRVIVGAAYVITLGLQIPLYTFATTGLAFAVAESVQRLAGIAVMLATAAALVHRVRAADRAFRRILVPLYLYGVFAALAVAFSGALFALFAPDATVQLAVIQLVILAGVPIAFVWGVSRGGFARTGELTELSEVLLTETVDTSPLSAALARTLGDPTIRVLFRRPGGNFVTEQGSAVSEDADGVSRARVPVIISGDDGTVIEYDPRLTTDPQHLTQAGQILAIALDRTRLSAELLASQREVAASRARLVDAADRERARIARDLHDGLQAQLVLLAVEAQQMATAPDTSARIRSAATDLRVRIDAAAADLRRLVHDVLPLPLTDGLDVAIEDLVDRVPLSTTSRIAVGAAPLPPPVVNTAYFVVAEALANALKHAATRSVDIEIVRAGDTMTVTVTDSGIGGADREGRGLIGLADRVDALGGELVIEERVPTGTIVRAELPCVL
ncbi:sensor histidine kinase [Microbacterium sediminicola]|uniref:histidine kinase n=1 Tax=Microbacterium sediminicola TaxID=415210 RepID=A0ABN2IFK2_9MICO